MNTQQETQASDVNSTPVQSLSVGKTLREAREQLGLSVADVANRIKFAPRQIEWLEEDDYVRLPEAAFVRGFVRSYARLVELDPSHLLPSLPSSHVQAAATHEVKSVEIPMPTAFTARRHNIIWLAAALVIALSLAIFERMHDRSPSQGKAAAKAAVEPIELPLGAIDNASAPLAEQAQQAAEAVEEKPRVARLQAVPAPVPAPAPAPAIKQSVRIVPAPVAPVPAAQPVVPQAAAPAVAQPELQAAAPQQTARAKQPAAAPKPAPSGSAMLPWQPIPQVTAHADQAQAQHAAPASASAEQPKAAAESSGTDHALRIELDEDAWVEVKDSSDKILISKMFSAGSLVRVAGKAPMQVTLGNARAVRLFDNGKKVNLARYTTAEVAKVKLK